ncbi:MAG: hypothetical protein WC622_05385, partial [Pedobacter sp.]|uniref:hypothetical protein n=1 Tax=Pedobacter sp. TaxID=1411316 RepID=UPI0035663A3E
WKHKYTKRSADRTRVFVLKSFLGWAVESLEMYLTELNRKPKLLESDTFTSLYSKAGQSVYKKTILIADEINVDPILIALMEVLITWRNYTFHYDIDNEIRESSMQCLIDKTDEVKARFSGLDINQLKTTWEKGGDFTFKETASLIKATQDFVNSIDDYILVNLDYLKFYIETTQRHFGNSKPSKTRYASFDKEKRKKYIKVLLQNIAGVADLEDNIINSIMKEIEKK